MIALLVAAWALGCVIAGTLIAAAIVLYAISDLAAELLYRAIDRARALVRGRQ